MPFGRSLGIAFRTGTTAAMGEFTRWGPPLGRRWWLLQSVRVVAALGIAVAVHGVSDSSVLAVVALFTVIGVSESAVRGPSPLPRQSPLPIPRHPLIAVTCAVIATGSWAITHYALHGTGQEMAPAVAYIAGIYIWVLQDTARDEDAAEATAADQPHRDSSSRPR